ncbi:MAG: DUF4363 family protein [Clostridia bacterium]|nr:DUF4363 family protein [Clostridia bacterium]
MKRLFYALVILLFITAVCIFGSILICHYCENSKEELSFCLALCEEEDWKSAEALSIDAIDNWKKREKFMAIFIDHKLLDNITEAISTLPIYANLKSKSDFYASCSQITVIIDRIRDSQTFHIENFY